MKRFLLTGAAIVACFLLQTTVFQKLALASVVPNLLLVVTVAVGYMRGEKEGMYAGLLCGLLSDCVYGEIIGPYSLIYLAVGYLNGFCRRLYYSENIVVPIALVGASDLLYNFAYYVFEFLFRSRLHLLFYVRRIMIPEMIYTVFVAVFLYRALQAANAALEGGKE